MEDRLLQYRSEPVRRAGPPVVKRAVTTTKSVHIKPLEGPRPATFHNLIKTTLSHCELLVVIYNRTHQHGESEHTLFIYVCCINVY